MTRFLTALVVFIGLAGCASIDPVTPETPREKLVAAEAAYEFALLEVRSLIVNGVIEPGTSLADTVGILIVETRNALDVWQSNPDDPNFILAATVALQRLQLEIARHVVTEESNLWPPGLEGWGGLTLGKVMT